MKEDPREEKNPLLTNGENTDQVRGVRCDAHPLVPRNRHKVSESSEHTLPTLSESLGGGGGCCRGDLATQHQSIPRRHDDAKTKLGKEDT